MTAYRRKNNRGEVIYIVKRPASPGGRIDRAGDPITEQQFDRADLLKQENTDTLNYLLEKIPGPDLDGIVDEIRTFGQAGIKQQSDPKVKGQRKLTQAEFDMINAGKEAERAYLEHIDRIERFLKELGIDLHQDPSRPLRSIAEARTCIETGAMWAARAVARNTPVK